MRDIKFRAWDNENEYMITSKQGVFTALQYYMNITRQDDGYYNDGGLLSPIKGKYSLMQYTGLKDKNGKEIYEGDILKGTFYGFMAPEYDFVFSVYWDEKEKGFMANYFEPSECEVIGNIYDNKDLLEEM